MKSLKFWLLFLCPLILSAQDNQSPRPEYAYVSLLYGTRNYSDNFYSQFNTIQHQTFFNPVQLVGLGVCTPPEHFKTKTGKLIRYVQHLSFTQVIPQEIKILDTISGKLTGFVFGMSLGIDLLGNTKHFNFMVSGGFNTGRLRIYQNELLRQKNPFFSPKIAIEPGVRFEKLIISVRGEYEYDVSGGNWRRTIFANKDKVNLNSFHQSGLTAFLSVGILIFKEQN
jgi:hypothetical protein